MRLPVIDDAERGNVVDDTTILSVVEVVATVITTVTAEERREESNVVGFWIEWAVNNRLKNDRLMLSFSKLTHAQTPA